MGGWPLPQCLPSSHPQAFIHCLSYTSSDYLHAPLKTLLETHTQTFVRMLIINSTRLAALSLVFSLASAMSTSQFEKFPISGGELLDTILQKCVQSGLREYSPRNRSHLMAWLFTSVRVALMAMTPSLTKNCIVGEKKKLFNSQSTLPLSRQINAIRELIGRTYIF